MNSAEKIKLKKQYEVLADSLLNQMLAEGKNAYVEGAYELLQEEAVRRGLEINNQVCGEEKVNRQEAVLSVESRSPTDAYVQLMIVNCDSDQAFVESLFTASGIPYFFQNLSIRPHKTFPLGLFVEDSRVEEAIGFLKDFKPGASIALW